MKHNRIRLATLFALSLALATTLSFAGDLERFLSVGYTPKPECDYYKDIVLERWDNPLGLNWHVRVENAVTKAIIPGLPLDGCSSYPGSAPGYQSILRGMTAWNGLTDRAYACSGGAPFGTVISTFATAPASDPFLFSETFGDDEFSLITFWEDEAFWDCMGGMATLAVTSVWGSFSAENTEFLIEEADIAFNAECQSETGNRYWSWVEWNDSVPVLEGQVLSNELAPVYGFVDVQGFTTHEAGHAAGLGHSPVDSAAGPNNNTFATMFPRAQATSFDETITLLDTSICNHAGYVPVSGDDTPIGGILGLAARTLARDDTAALSRGYPAASFSSATGEISGSVSVVLSTPPFSAWTEAVSVVAIGKNCPNKNRVGTLSYGGQFRLSGLPPGDYYLQVERIDLVYCTEYIDCSQGVPAPDPINCGVDDDHRPYFGLYGDLPNYADRFASCPPAGWSTCGPLQPNCPCRWDYNGAQSPGVFVTEFWNANDEEDELPMKADVITVTAGGVSSGHHFVLDARSWDETPDAIARPHLEIQVIEDPGWSPRGSRTSRREPGAGNRTVQFRVTASSDYVGESVTIHLGTSLKNKLLANHQNQLRQVDVPKIGYIGSGPAGNAQKINGTMSSSGGLARFTFTRPLGPSDDFTNLFAQAFVAGDGGREYTNVVNVWVQSRELP